jgi:hypothetical protein
MKDEAGEQDGQCNGSGSDQAGQFYIDRCLMGHRVGDGAQ